MRDCRPEKSPRPAADRNTGGFSSELKPELFLWLRSQRHISAFLLQETHWGFTNEWKRDGWYLFHSAASKPRTGGVLTAIRTEIVREEDLSWKEIIPGRLTQVAAISADNRQTS